MEGIILAARLQRAGRSEDIPEVFPGVVYQNDCSMANGLELPSKVEDSDIKRFRRLWWLCHTSSSLWCSSTCLLSFIPASVIPLSDNEDFGGTPLPFLHHLCHCSPTVGVLLLRDVTHSEHGCHTHRNERIWTDKIIFYEVFTFQLLHLSN
ncbi:hypothetical protein TNCT_513811 [Trichonephila clavata]|uniref:Uncharacterized protein n=1 Tax=Trichonephila clavata TaxID=2740835 RepID=A0A8X6M6Q4_TRICU|nr:hypothetical protein TNCT_513811 [Trichonephila clavata]